MPIALLLVAMSSFQLGGALAKQLFPVIGPVGTSSLRTLLAAALLWGVYRPWRGPFPKELRWAVIRYGLAIAGLNTFFYLALQRIPLGIAVAIDFIGPLGLAIAYSRRWIDSFWVGLAALGVALLFPIGGDVARLDPLGVVFCLGSAVCWAAYIVFGKTAAAHLPSGRLTAIGLTIGAAFMLPLGLAQASEAFFSLAVLPVGLVVAVLSSALPYNLEMVALKRLPTAVFGVLMSLEPGFGALYGWLILGERLTARQDVAIVCVILASAGVTLTASRGRPS